MSKSRAKLATAVLLLGAGVAAGVHLGLERRSDGNAEAAALREAAPPPAAVYVVRRRDLARTVTLTSELRPYNVVNLYAKVAGYLQTIDVDYGSHVAAGETLATLELPEQQADVERTQAAYRLAAADYERIASVAREEPGLIAQVDVDKAQAAYEMARDDRDQAATIMDYSVITAPFDGVVTKRYVDPGALIQQGTTGTSAEPIVQIADNYRLRMVVETPESIVPDIYVGMPVTVRIQATGKTIPDRIARFSYDVHEDTRTMHTEIDVENADLHIKPGMYASVTLDLADRRGVVAVPLQALATTPVANVWIVDNHDIVRERPVTVGLQTPDWVEITHGVSQGDRLFFGDRSSLAIGSHVAPKVVAATGY